MRPLAHLHIVPAGSFKEPAGTMRSRPMHFMVLLPVDLNPLKSSLLSQCEIARIKPARTGVQGDTRRVTYAHLWSVFSYTVIYGVGSP